MIPVIIQKRGAVHLAEEEAAGDILLGRSTEPTRSRILQQITDPSILDLIPESVARENLVFPLRLHGETLHVAAANPNDLLVADKLTFIINKKIRLVGMPRQDILDAIDEHYGQTVTASVDSMLTDFTDTSARFDRWQQPTPPAAGARGS